MARWGVGNAIANAAVAGFPQGERSAAIVQLTGQPSQPSRQSRTQLAPGVVNAAVQAAPVVQAAPAATTQTRGVDTRPTDVVRNTGAGIITSTPTSMEDLVTTPAKTQMGGTATRAELEAEIAALGEQDSTSARKRQAELQSKLNEMPEVVREIASQTQTTGMGTGIMDRTFSTGQEDEARSVAWLNSLTPEQRAKAVIADKARTLKANLENAQESGGRGTLAAAKAAYEKIGGDQGYASAMADLESDPQLAAAYKDMSLQMQSGGLGTEGGTIASIAGVALLAALAGGSSATAAGGGTSSTATGGGLANTSGTVMSSGTTAGTTAATTTTMPLTAVEGYTAGTGAATTAGTTAGTTAAGTAAGTTLETVIANAAKQALIGAGVSAGVSALTGGSRDEIINAGATGATYGAVGSLIGSAAGEVLPASVAAPVATVATGLLASEAGPVNITGNTGRENRPTTIAPIQQKSGMARAGSIIKAGAKEKKPYESTAVKLTRQKRGY